MPRLRNTVILLLLPAGLIFACECQYAPPCTRIHKSAAIFSGRVLDAGRDGGGPFRFEVDEQFKGLGKDVREVAVEGGLCMSGYKPGQRYLVLAGRAPNGSLFSGDCTGTVVIERAEDDLRIIRAWAQGSPSPQLQGRIAENIEDDMVRYELQVEKRPGLAGVELIATKDGVTFRGVSDASGIFRVPVPGPGNYSVVAVHPGLTASKAAYEFNVEPGSCAEHDIGMWTDSEVIGLLFDRAHQPVADFPVEMMGFSRDSAFSPLTAITDATGRFKFAKVPQGEYLLGVNINGLNSTLPYEPQFYPGVTRRELAVPIRVGGPGSLKDLNFQIGNRRTTRPIRVTVVWPDGKPVTNASVACRSPRSDDRRYLSDWISRYTDSKGEAICEVLTDREFHVEVDRLQWSASSRPVQPIATRPKIFVGSGSEPVFLRIEVDRVNDISDKESPSEMSAFNEKNRHRE